MPCCRGCEGTKVDSAESLETAITHSFQELLSLVVQQQKLEAADDLDHLHSAKHGCILHHSTRRNLCVTEKPGARGVGKGACRSWRRGWPATAHPKRFDHPASGGA